MTAPFTFAEFMVAVHGFEPFPWQQKLAERALADNWPERIDVPTGLGKTAVLDVAVYALAATAAEPPSRRLSPTRIAFIVDRRVVVQAAFGHACRIRDALRTGAEAVTAWAADRLRHIGASIADPLPEPLVVTQMRGGVTWESRWVRRPDQPAIVVGTVDQLGSRLLFRAYGLSDRMKPIDAALIGNDTLIVLDEAHLSSPLVETLTGVRCVEQRASDRPLVTRPSRAIELTATPRVDPDEHLVADEDESNREAALRLTAVKRAHLISLEHAAGAKADRELAAALARVASTIANRGDPTVVLVVANTIAVARDVFTQVGAGGDVDAELVIGRCRTLDREAGRARWWDSAKAGRDRRSIERPLVIVATQTVEVGADLDVDALITEVAPIDALVQRFGRVDRLGRLAETDSYILHAPGRVAGDAPPYGRPTAESWSWLHDLAGGALRVSTVKSLTAETADSAPWIDLGPIAFRARLARVERRATLLSVPQLPPVVLPQCVRVWRRTSPIPEPDESITSYLHGLGRGEPSVAVAWRAGDLDTILNDVPPRSQELVEIGLGALRRFLRGEAPRRSEADIEGSLGEQGETQSRVPVEIDAVRVRRGDEWVRPARVGDLRPGDVVVLSVEAGGHDEFGWTGERGHDVTDVADLVTASASLGQLRPTLRLEPAALANLLRVDASIVRQTTERYAADVLDAFVSGSAITDATIRMLSELRAVAANEVYSTAVTDLFDRLSQPTTWSLGAATSRESVLVADIDDEDPDHPTVTLRRLIAAAPKNVTSAAEAADDDDDVSTSLTGGEVVLSTHLESVGNRAEAIAARLGLDSDLVATVRLAGRFHDLGKADVRFQALLRSSQRWLAEALGADAGQLLAKSATRPRRRREAASDEWPIGYRHEAISLALVDAAPDSVFLGLDRELVAHLVASHHGHARPLFPAVDDPDNVKVRVDFEGHAFVAGTELSHPNWAQPARFAALCEKYGTWGLALLEAIVRLADIAVSEEGG